MFPTPTTTPASIRKAFTGPRRPAAARGQHLAAEARLQRLGRPGGRSGGRPRAPPSSAAKTTPKRRGSRSRSRRPDRRWKATCSCGSSGASRRHQRQPAAHPQVDDHRPPPFEVDQQVLRPPPQRDHLPPARRPPQPGHVHRLAQGGVAHLDALDPVAHQVGLQAAAQDFDLGELGHDGGFYFGFSILDFGLALRKVGA